MNLPLTFKNRLKLSALKCLPLIAILTSAQTAMGVVYVNFQQQGDDVRVSFDGVLTLTNVPTMPMSSIDASALDIYQQTSSILYVIDASNTYPLTSAGQASASSLGSGFFNTFSPGFSFGFDQSSLYWDDTLVTGGSDDSPTELTLDSLSHFYTIEDTTLTAMGADGLSEGQILWTATQTLGGDTIQVTLVPEPSSLALLAFGGVALIARRRKV